MTKDERIEAIRKLAAQHSNPTTWLTGHIIFLLAKLDAANARVQRLTDAAQAVIERWDTPLWKNAEPTAATINRLRAALAEGEDTRG